MKTNKTTAKNYVSETIRKSISNCRSETEVPQYVSIDYNGYAESTIRKAIRACGYNSIMDDCGNMFAKKR